MWPHVAFDQWPVVWVGLVGLKHVRVVLVGQAGPEGLVGLEDLECHHRPPREECMEASEQALLAQAVGLEEASLEQASLEQASEQASLAVGLGLGLGKLDKSSSQWWKPNHQSSM